MPQLPAVQHQLIAAEAEAVLLVQAALSMLAAAVLEVVQVSF